jgi:hypothetical protein
MKINFMTPHGGKQVAKVSTRIATKICQELLSP